MKKSLGITSVKSVISFHEKMLENFVNNSVPYRSYREQRNMVLQEIPGGYSQVDCCFARMPVRGALEIFYTVENRTRKIKIPISSRFLVTCTRQGNAAYKVCWACCMS